MLWHVSQHCDIHLGFCVHAKDYSCFPYIGEIQVLNELIICLLFFLSVGCDAISSGLFYPFFVFELT